MIQLMRVILFVLLIIVTNDQAFAASPKRALKLLEKQKYEKVEKQLEKVLEKDSISPGAHYVYSLLYLDTGYHHYHIDTSWYHINKAITQMKLIDEKALSKLARDNINDSTIHQQKLAVDAAAFAKAKDNHTIASYDYFIDHHPTAPQVSQAIDLRNEIAWQDAKSTNTYESYLYFINTYPEARQIKEAVELYDILLYQEKTNTGKLDDYVNFLQENPNTPYRSDAELNILKLSSLSNDIIAYKSFLQQYPKSVYAPLAKNFLYHTFKHNNPPNTFFDNFLFSPTDSLDYVISLEKDFLIPVLDENNNEYGFRNYSWQLIIDHQYQDIPSDYYCGNISSDVLQVTDQTGNKIIGRNGAVIWSADFTDYDDIGYGFLKIKLDEQIQLIHKSGYPLPDTLADDASIIGGTFIKIVKNKKAGLVSFLGVPLIEARYDDIEFQDGFIIFESDDMYALATPQLISENITGNSFTPRFLYDEVEILDNGMVRCYRQDAETILNEKLQTIIPFEKHQIYQLNQGWLIKQEKKYQILNENFLPITNASFDQVQYNQHWVAVAKDDQWSFLSGQADLLTGFVYDSARIISDHFAYLSSKDSVFLFTDKGHSILLEDFVRLQLLKDAHAAGQADESVEFIVVAYDNDRKKIFNNEGKEIINGKFNHATALGNEYLLIEYRNKSLYDTKGNQLLKSIYDGIGNYKNRYVSLLRNKKFGIYNQAKGVEILPQYDALLKPYGDSLILASEDNLWGLLNLEGDQLVDFQYQKIELWNDSSALVLNEEDLWQIISIAGEEVLVNDFDDFRYIKNNEEEKIIQINAGAKYGIYSNRNGEIVPPTFNEIVNLGTAEKPVYFAEKNIREADFFVIVYYSQNGEILQRQAFTAEQYDKIYCQ